MTYAYTFCTTYVELTFGQTEVQSIEYQCHFSTLQLWSSVGEIERWHTKLKGGTAQNWKVAQTKLKGGTPQIERWHTPFWKVALTKLKGGTPHFERWHRPNWKVAHPILKGGTDQQFRVDPKQIRSQARASHKDIQNAKKYVSTPWYDRVRVLSLSVPPFNFERWHRPKLKGGTDRENEIS